MNKSKIKSIKITKTETLKIFLFFLLLQPFLDISYFLGDAFKINGIKYCSVIVRSLFLIFASVILIRRLILNYKKDQNIKKYLLLLLIIGYSSLFLIDNFFKSNMFELVVEIKQYSKVLFMPVALLFSYYIIDNQNSQKISKLLSKNAVLYSLLILIAQTTTIVMSSYTTNKLGNSGWFYSPNEIGATLAILFPVLVYHFLNDKKISLFWSTIMIVSYASSGLVIGTKVPMLAMLIVLAFYVGYLLLKTFFDKNKKNIKIALIKVLVPMIAIAFLFPITPTAKNLNIHLKMLKDKTSSRVMTEESKIKNYILSSRDEYNDLQLGQYSKSNIKEKALGMGFYNNNQFTKFVELDFNDLLYKIGVLGSISILFAPIYILFESIKFFFSEKIYKNINQKIFFYGLSVCLGFGIAAVSGHVFFSPSSSIYLVIVLILLNKEIKRAGAK